MARAAQEVVVFLASPSDCQAERTAVHRAADRMNATLGPLTGRRILVTGWEQVRPELGRPQELINPLVDNCDVFIGILNRRWGTSTGVATSGFYEEFTRAIARRADSTSPSIAVYFKDVPPELLEDPGKELKKVLTFKRQLVNDKTALYGTFKSTEDLELQIHQDLMFQLVQFGEAGSPGGVQGTKDAGDGADQGGASGIEEDASEPDAARSQLAEVLEFWLAAARGTVRSEEMRADNDRLLLFALAFSDDGGSISPHVANRLFIRHAELHLSVAERALWLRTMLEDAHVNKSNTWGRVIPGWAILLEDPSRCDRLVEEVSDLASGVDRPVASGAFIVLRQIGARPDRFWCFGSPLPKDGENRTSETVELWKTAITDAAVKTSALEYIAAVARDEDLLLIRALAEAIRELPLAELSSYLAGDASSLALSVASSHAVEDWKVRLLGERLSTANSECLSYLITGRATPAQLRKNALQELVRRGSLSVELIAALLGDDDLADMLFELVKSRSMAVATVEQAIESLDNALTKAEVVPRLEAIKVPVEELRKRLETDFIPVDAWESLSWLEVPPDDIYDMARVIFDSDGEGLVSKLRQLDYVSPDESLFRFLKSRARVAALRVITHRLPLAEQDLARLRSEVVRAEAVTQVAALDFLAAAGGTEDAMTIIHSRTATFGESRQRLVERALAMNAGSAGRELLVQGNQEEKRLALEVLNAQGKLTTDELKELLYSDDGEVRVAAVGVLTSRLTRPEVLALIEEYPTPVGRMHFYNVIVELDTSLYGPRATT